MIARIVNFALDNRFLVIVLWLLVAGVGVRSMLNLPIDAVPDVTNVQVQVLTNSPGVAPEEMEQFITFPVESAMSGLPKVEEIRSVSKFGLSVVTVVFDEGTDIYWARQLVGEKLNTAREQIPPGYGNPELGPISTGLGEIFQFEVRADRMCGSDPDTEDCFTPMELRTILDWNIAFRLRAVQGVVEVNSFGGELKTYQVTAEPSKLRAYGLAMGDVFAALRTNNENVGGGYIAHQGEQYLVRGEALLEDLSDIREIVLKANVSGTPVRIADVATVELAPMIRQGAVTRGGDGEAVIGIVMMLIGENAREVVGRVKGSLSQIEKSLPAGVSIDVFYDRTDLIQRTINTVTKNLIEGGLLVILVLFLLLGNFRAGLIVAAAIPMSMLVAFTFMQQFGIAGNLMSLGAIDFGLIVDGSVVMIENIVRVLAHRKAGDERPHLERVRDAALQVARPVVFAVGIIMIVYLPILGLMGVEGKMFRPMALTVVFALGGSLLLALTLMPVMASLFLQNVRESEPWLFRIAKRAYEPALGLAVRRRGVTFVSAITLFLVSLATAPFLGAEFMPRLDEGAIAMQVWRLPSVSLEQSNDISTKVEKLLVDTFPEIKTIISRTGRAEIATDPMGVEISDTYIILEEPEKWRFDSKAELIDAIDDTLKEGAVGAIFSYSQPIELRVSELISGVRSDIALYLYGDDLALLKSKADELVGVLQKIPGAAEVKAEQTTGLPMLRVRLDRRAMARYGVDASHVLETIQAVGGAPVGVILEGQQRFTLQVRIPSWQRERPDQIGELRLVAPAGDGGERRLIPLHELADIWIDDGPAQISREAISRRISVELNVRGRDIASFVAEAQRAVDEQVEIPAGYLLDWGGQFENLAAASRRLATLVPLALLLIFVLLYSSFNSGRIAALIYLNVPMAVTGGIFALALRGYPFSISAGVGFIALFGIAVLNGVVLVTYIVELRGQGVAADEAAQEAARIRLRPVLMTALVASFGFVPMAMATSAGAEVQRPLATVVIGGLISSTLLTLLVLPAVYRWIAGGHEPAAGRVGGQADGT